MSFPDLDQHVRGLIPSKQFDVWERLYRRYLLEPFPLEGSAAAVGLTIFPVTQADELLKKYELELSPNLDITAASGGFVEGITVPVDERWELTFFNRAASTGLSAIAVLADGVVHNLSLRTAAQQIDTSIRLMLPPSAQIGLITTGNGGDTAINFSIATIRETLF